MIEPQRDEDTKVISGLAGEEIGAGMIVRRDRASRRWMKARSDSADHAEAGGIALNAARMDEPIEVLTRGTVDVDRSVVPGEIYVVSDKAGEFKAVRELSPREFLTIVAVGVAAFRLMIVGCVSSGVAITEASS